MRSVLYFPNRSRLAGLMVTRVLIGLLTGPVLPVLAPRGFKEITTLSVGSSRWP